MYFSARTARALDRWLRERRRHRWAHLDAFFLGERGRLTPDGVRDIVKIRGGPAGVEGVHPHRFRHSFAHDFLLSGGGERDLKRLAGWTSDAMLERYGSAAADLRAREAAKRLRRGRPGLAAQTWERGLHHQPAQQPLAENHSGVPRVLRSWVAGILAT